MSEQRLNLPCSGIHVHRWCKACRCSAAAAVASLLPLQRDTKDGGGQVARFLHSSVGTRVNIKGGKVALVMCLVHPKRREGRRSQRLLGRSAFIQVWDNDTFVLF